MYTQSKIVHFTCMNLCIAVFIPQIQTYVNIQIQVDSQMVRSNNKAKFVNKQNINTFYI